MESFINTDIQTGLIFVIAFAFAYLFLRDRKHSKLPPGPFSLPIVGTLPWLGADLREPLQKLKQTYGDVFTVYLGSKPAVILCSHDAIKEAFVTYGHSLSGRPQDLFFIKELTNGRGVVSSEGEVWKQQRKFTHNILREFGVGKTILEDKIKEELSFFIQEIESQNGQSFDPTFILQSAVANVICNIVYGSRFEYEDKIFKDLIETINKSFEVLGNAGVLTVFPILRHLPGDIFKYKWLKYALVWTVQFDLDRIEEHRQTRTPGVIRDLIDAYLVEIEKQKDNENSTFYDMQLRQVIGDLFSAGTETTATTLRWALCYLLHNPDIQMKIQKEIDEVIGPHRLPSMSDKASMPYTEACILETQRMGDIVPLGVPHTVTEDITFRGFTLPTGTEVYSNLYSVHRDANTWEDPYTFTPDRFLDEDGKVFRREDIIPFSMGKRICLGESLAKMELFLFLTSMLQRFTFVQPEGAPLPDLTGKLGITNLPLAFEVITNYNEH